MLKIYVETSNKNKNNNINPSPLSEVLGSGSDFIHTEEVSTVYGL